MASERVAEALRARGVDADIRQFPQSTRTAADAAAAVGTTVGQIVKSLVFLADGRPVLVLHNYGIPLWPRWHYAVAIGFDSQRRKMIRSSLRSLLDDPEGTIAAAGLDATARAEDLAPGDWLRLAGAA